MKMKVLKFGGKSIDTPEKLQYVAGLIKNKKESIVIAPAIPEITFALEDISDYLYKKNIEGANERINKLYKILSSFVSALFINEETEIIEKYIDSKIDYIQTFTRGLFTLFEERVILAQGELISSYFLYTIIKRERTDIIELQALNFMKIDKNREPDTNFIKENLSAVLREYNSGIYLTQGYICRNAYGEIDDFRKGGNDISATLIGSAINAAEIQIWTDDNGMPNIDPEIINNTTKIKRLSFDEAAELAYFGDKVLHPTSILPAKLANIPVRILSTLAPDDEGTLISDETDKNTVKAVAAKDNITSIKIISGKMLLAHGFLRRIFEIFELFRTPVDMLTSSEVGVSMTIDDTHNLGEITDDLKKHGTVTIDKGMTIICIIGDLGWENTTMRNKILNAVKDIPVRMISYGGSQYNFSFLIEEKDKKKALQALNAGIF